MRIQLTSLRRSTRSSKIGLSPSMQVRVIFKPLTSEAGWDCTVDQTSHPDAAAPPPGRFHYVVENQAGTDTCAYVIDTSFKCGHEQLKTHWQKSASCTTDVEGNVDCAVIGNKDNPGTCNISDDHGHGIHVFGTIVGMTLMAIDRTMVYCARSHH